MNRHMPNSNPPSAMENDHGPAYPAQPSPYSSNATSPPFTTSTDIFENQTALSVSQPPSPPQPPRRLNTRSCDVCRKRKVKCDKVSTGCSNCTKAHVECHYPAPGRAPRRPKSGKQISAREAELLKRLRRLEGVVQELSGQSEEPQRSATSSPRERLRKERDGDSERGSPFGNEQRAEIVRVVGMDEGNPMTRKWLNRLVNIGDGPPLGDVIEREFGKLVLDEEKSHYINNDLFAALGHEVYTSTSFCRRCPEGENIELILMFGRWKTNKRCSKTVILQSKKKKTSFPTCSLSNLLLATKAFSLATQAPS